MSNPRLTDTVEATELDGEVILFNRASSRMLRLNSIAGLIVYHCDGEHSAAEIVERLAELLPDVDRAVLAHDVETTLEQLAREEILV